MKTDNISQDDWIIGGLALLVTIAVLFLPWFSLGGGQVGPISIPSLNLTGTDTPDGWLGVLAVIASIGVLVDLGIERLSPQTAVPAVGGSRTNTRFLLAAGAALFMGLKFLFHLGHFSDLGYGFWVGAVLVIALVVFASRARQAGDVASAAPPPPPPPPPAPAAGGSAGPPPA